MHRIYPYNCVYEHMTRVSVINDTRFIHVPVNTTRVSYAYLLYTIRVSYAYLLYTIRMPYAYLLYTVRVSYAYRIRIIRVSYAYRIRIIRVSYAYRIRIIRVSYAYRMLRHTRAVLYFYVFISFKAVRASSCRDKLHM